MKKVIVEKFGGIDVLVVHDLPTHAPPPGQVRVKITSIGMNHADIMARQGKYLISSGMPPFTPGIEGGGVIDAVGEGVTIRKVGQRVSIGAEAPRRATINDVAGSMGGTYTSHYYVPAEQTVLIPDVITDQLSGTLWLPYLTAYGCLIWKQNLQPGQFVAIPAASSSLGLAAAQIAKERGAITIAMTTSAAKAEILKTLPESKFDHYIVTNDANGEMRHWHKDIRLLTKKHGVDVFFDPVAAGAYLDMEINSIAQHGTVWVYGLLGTAGKVDVTPLIRKFASVRGWYLKEITDAGGAVLQQGYDYIFDGFKKGIFKQRVAQTFPLDKVQDAHHELELGRHIGKMILVP